MSRMNLKALITFTVQSVAIQVAITLISNFMIKRHKNFAQTVRKIDDINAQLEEIRGRISSADQASTVAYLTKDLEAKSQEIIGLQMKIRILSTIIGFIFNRVLTQKYVGIVMLRSPVSLVGPLKKMAHSGLKNAHELDIGINLYAQLLNRGVKALLVKYIAVRIPKGKSPMAMAKKFFGMSAEEMQQTEKFGSMMGIFG